MAQISEITTSLVSCQKKLLEFWNVVKLAVIN